MQMENIGLKERSQGQRSVEERRTFLRAGGAVFTAAMTTNLLSHLLMEEAEAGDRLEVIKPEPYPSLDVWRKDVMPKIIGQTPRLIEMLDDDNPSVRERAQGILRDYYIQTIHPLPPEMMNEIFQYHSGSERGKGLSVEQVIALRQNVFSGLQERRVRPTLFPEGWKGMRQEILQAWNAEMGWNVEIDPLVPQALSRDSCSVASSRRHAMEVLFDLARGMNAVPEFHGFNANAMCLRPAQMGERLIGGKEYIGKFWQGKVTEEKKIFPGEGEESDFLSWLKACVCPIRKEPLKENDPPYFVELRFDPAYRCIAIEKAGIISAPHVQNINLCATPGDMGKFASGLPVYFSWREADRRYFPTPSSSPKLDLTVILSTLPKEVDIPLRGKERYSDGFQSFSAHVHDSGIVLHGRNESVDREHFLAMLLQNTYACEADNGRNIPLQVESFQDCGDGTMTLFLTHDQKGMQPNSLKARIFTGIEKREMEIMLRPE